MKEINCPKCRQAMGTAGRPVLTCSGCEGVWLSPDEYNSLLNHDGSRIELASLLKNNAEKSPLSCPQCMDQQLSVSSHAGIEVDWCDSCSGVYFDKGELSQIREYLSTLRSSGDTSVTMTAADLGVGGVLDLLFGAIRKIV